MIGTEIADMCKHINDMIDVINKHFSCLSSSGNFRSFKIVGMDIAMVNNNIVPQIMIDTISSKNNDGSDGSHIVRPDALDMLQQPFSLKLQVWGH